MANEQIDFDDWSSGAEGAGERVVDAGPDEAMKRAAYQGNRIMTRPDGSYIQEEVPAQLRQPAPQRPQPRPNPASQAILDAYEDAQQDYEQQAAQERTLQETFTEAERRFDKAKYYKLLLGQPIFSDSSAAGEEVEAEVRTFAQERFEVFLGMRQERGAIPAVFDGWEKEDFDALLQLIRTIRAKAGLVTAAVSKPAAPKAEPSIAQRAPAAPTATAEPTLRPRTLEPQKLGQNPPTRVPGPAPTKAQRQPKGARQRKLKPLIDPYTGQVKVGDDGRPLMKDVTPQVRPSADSGYIPPASGKAAIESLYATKANEAAGDLETKLARAGEKGMMVRTAMTVATHTSHGGQNQEVVYDGADYRPDPTLMVASDNEAGYVRNG
jgi:hypothetical protein